jgi:hypothetical protein
MPPYPFTPEGVQQMQEELYVKSDADLQAQAALIAGDFRQWVADMFFLSSAQQAYLYELDDSFVEMASFQLNTAVIWRLNVFLIVPAETMPASKLVRTTNNFVPVSSHEERYRVTGTLTFIFYYE